MLEALQNLHLCNYDHFPYEFIERIAGWLRKEVGLPIVAHLAYLIIENCKLLP